MKIKESMVKGVATVPSNAWVHKAVKLMNKNKIGCLLVVDYSQTTGILTKRDILTGAWKKEKIHKKQKSRK